MTVTPRDDGEALSSLRRMQRKLVRVSVIASIIGCRGGHVTDVGSAPRDLGDYESVVVRVSSGRDVLRSEEIVELEGELVQRLQKDNVFARVSRDDRTAQLSVDVVVDKLDDTRNPLDINGRLHAEARATVEVVDRRDNRSLGRFAVEATDRPTIILAEKGTVRTIALRNVARTSARKLRASR